MFNFFIVRQLSCNVSPIRDKLQTLDRYLPKWYQNVAGCLVKQSNLILYSLFTSKNELFKYVPTYSHLSINMIHSYLYMYEYSFLRLQQVVSICIKITFPKARGSELLPLELWDCILLIPFSTCFNDQSLCKLPIASFSLHFYLPIRDTAVVECVTACKM